MIREEFGNEKAVFANQDDSIFSAIPITLDSNVYTLETETVNGRTYAKAGSVVKEGSIIRGILPEKYDITDGPTAARVALEGYAYASRLTVEAIAAVSALPKIVLMPYKATIVRAEEVAGLGLKIVIEGAKFATSIATNKITTSSGTVSKVVTAADQNSITVYFTQEGEVAITAIDSDAFAYASGTVLKGLPITANVELGDKHAVSVTAGSNGTASADKSTAAEGEIVTITATPSSDYQVDTVKVDGVAIEYDSGYKFVMPNSAVAVAVTFKVQG